MTEEKNKLFLAHLFEGGENDAKEKTAKICKKIYKEGKKQSKEKRNGLV